MNRAIVSLFGTLSAGIYWTRKEGKELERGGLWGGVEGFYIGEATERDKTDLSRAACWRLPQSVRSGEDGCGKVVGVVDEVNESVANIVVDGDCDIGRKMGDSCIVSRYGATTQGLICRW